MKNNVIVSLADSNYFELLNELIDSIKKFEQSKNISICVLDAGLKDDQIQNLNNKVEIIKKAGDLGFCSLYVSEEDGGMALGRLDSSIIIEQLSAGCTLSLIHI